mmetsp:Transcript_11938/g.32636  ORF Transcript_11938/g.32636 Transcript_11938/m.32636 type:complete len:325 (+) Transcript_11938:1191-2165(+)
MCCCLRQTSFGSHARPPAPPLPLPPSHHLPGGPAPPTTHLPPCLQSKPLASRLRGGCWRLCLATWRRWCSGWRSRRGWRGTCTCRLWVLRSRGGPRWWNTAGQRRPATPCSSNQLRHSSRAARHSSKAAHNTPPSCRVAAAALVVMVVVTMVAMVMVVVMMSTCKMLPHRKQPLPREVGVCRRERRAYGRPRHLGRAPSNAARLLRHETPSKGAPSLSCCGRRWLTTWRIGRPCTALGLLPLPWTRHAPAAEATPTPAAGPTPAAATMGVWGSRGLLAWVSCPKQARPAAATAAAALVLAWEPNPAALQEHLACLSSTLRTGVV